MPTSFGKTVKAVVNATDARVDVHPTTTSGWPRRTRSWASRTARSRRRCRSTDRRERAGNAAYEEVVMAVESVYGVDTGIDTTQITKLARIVEEASDIPVPANKPVTGRNAFAHESGIHAAGVIENADTFETGVMTPEMVGAEREFVLGKHTGTHSVRKHLVEAGFDPTDSEVRRITKRVRSTAPASVR